MFNFNVFSGLRRLAAWRLVRKVLPQHRVFTLHELYDLLENRVVSADLCFVLKEMILSREVRLTCVIDNDEPLYVDCTRGGTLYDLGLFVQHNHPRHSWVHFLFAR